MISLYEIFAKLPVQYILCFKMCMSVGFKKHLTLTIEDNCDLFFKNATKLLSHLFTLYVFTSFLKIPYFQMYITKTYTVPTFSIIPMI